MAPETKIINGVPKLTPNLHKRGYIVHHKVLRLYFEKGLKLKKIRRGVRYEESNFMKSYIDLNTERKNARNEFEVAFLS